MGTLLLTVLEISYSTRNPRPRRSFKFGRTGQNDAYRGTEEYLDGDECDPKIYNCEDVSDEESTVTPSPNAGDDCDEQVYDCDDYSYEIMNPPPVPAKPPPVKPHPVKPPPVKQPPPGNGGGDGHGGGHGGHGHGHGGGHGGGNENSQCKPPWIRLATGCYRFKDRPVRWAKAKEYCQDLGAKLVEIDSPQENEVIVDEIKKHSWSKEKKQFWMGLTDRRHEGFFVVESTGKEPRFTNWARRQPDNRGHWGGQEDCAYIKTNMQWNDWDCSANRHWGWTLNALCEKTGR